jgi:hypothetical protein
MSKWLSPRKVLDYHVVRRFEDVAEAERQLYLAVVRGDVRVRLNGKVLGPEWLKQLCRMKISGTSPFALPPEIEFDSGGRAADLGRNRKAFRPCGRLRGVRPR